MKKFLFCMGAFLFASGLCAAPSLLGGIERDLQKDALKQTVHPAPRNAPAEQRKAFEKRMQAAWVPYPDFAARHAGVLQYVFWQPYLASALKNTGYSFTELRPAVTLPNPKETGRLRVAFTYTPEGAEQPVFRAVFEAVSAGGRLSVTRLE